MRKFAIGLGMILAAATLLGAAPAPAQSFPSKPIRIIVGFPPGGGNDIVGRILAEKLTDRLGQTVLVENKPGANGIVGAETAAKAAPDGHTLLVGPIGTMCFNAGLYDKLPYDPLKDFTPITQIATFAVLFAVHPSVPAKNMKEFIELVRANPGKYNYAAGSSPFLAVAELLKKEAKLDIVQIPYKGSMQAVNAAMAGEVAFLSVDVPPAVPQIKAGKLRGLAVVGNQRSSGAPDLPTMTEAGVPNFEHTMWIGLFAPTGTPDPVIAKLHAEVSAVLKMPDVKERLNAIGFDPTGITPAQMAQVLKTDNAKWVKVVREAGLKAE